MESGQSDLSPAEVNLRILHELHDLADCMTRLEQRMDNLAASQPMFTPQIANPPANDTFQPPRRPTGAPLGNLRGSQRIQMVVVAPLKELSESHDPGEASDTPIPHGRKHPMGEKVKVSHLNKAVGFPCQVSIFQSILCCILFVVLVMLYYQLSGVTHCQQEVEKMKDSQQTLKQMVQKLQQTLDELRGKRQDELSKYEKLEKKIYDDQLKHKQDMEMMERKPKQEIEKMERKHEQEMEKMDRKHKQEMEKIERKHEQEMEKIRVQHQQDMEKIDKEHMQEQEIIEELHRQYLELKQTEWKDKNAKEMLKFAVEFILTKFMQYKFK